MKRIDLCQYAASRGFVVDRKQSSRASAVMRHSNGDKLIISKQPNGQYVYFNAKGNDNGTIIDLIQTRDRVKLGEVRKMLRPWLNSGYSPPLDPPAFQINLQPSEHDAAHVLAAWMKAQPVNGTHRYLEEDRCIPAHILQHEIFRDRIRVDQRRNSVFPHFCKSGLCGFEIKNRGFTGFSPGGVKGLACSRPQPDDNHMVVCETAIDMLSYAALNGTQGNRFFSTAGQISPMQAECLRSAAEKMPHGATVILAFDNDEGGHNLSAHISEALIGTGRIITNEFPPIAGMDWNDVLQGEATKPTRDSISPSP
ncbi:MAG: DUF3991 and TOPRIM domain-containing protein [Fuerstiella sp.]